MTNPSHCFLRPESIRGVTYLQINSGRNLSSNQFKEELIFNSFRYAMCSLTLLRYWQKCRWLDGCFGMSPLTIRKCLCIMSDAGIASCSCCAITIAFEFVYTLGRYINVWLLLLIILLLSTTKTIAKYIIELTGGSSFACRIQ